MKSGNEQPAKNAEEESARSRNQTHWFRLLALSSSAFFAVEGSLGGPDMSLTRFLLDEAQSCSGFLGSNNQGRRRRPGEETAALQFNLFTFNHLGSCTTRLGPRTLSPTGEG